MRSGREIEMAQPGQPFQSGRAFLGASIDIIFTTSVCELHSDVAAVLSIKNPATIMLRRASVADYGRRGSEISLLHPTLLLRGSPKSLMAD